MRLLWLLSVCQNLLYSGNCRAGRFSESEVRPKSFDRDYAHQILPSEPSVWDGTVGGDPPLGVRGGTPFGKKSSARVGPSTDERQNGVGRQRFPVMGTNGRAASGSARGPRPAESSPYTRLHEACTARDRTTPVSPSGKWSGGDEAGANAEPVRRSHPPIPVALLSLLASFRCGDARPCCPLRLSIPERSRFKTYRLIRILARLLLLCKPLFQDGLVCF